MKTVSLTEKRVQAALERARELEEAGEYRAAVEELSDFWSGPGAEPLVRGLDDRQAGELLLRAGSLCGRIGSAQQIYGSPESAKNLLTRAQERFLGIGDLNRLSEAQATLAVSYWRSGSFDEARAILNEALRAAPNLDADSKLRLMITLAMVEMQGGDLAEALRIYHDCVPLREQTGSPYLVGTYHGNHGLALKAAGRMDEALTELSAASLCLGEAGRPRYQAQMLNNVAMSLMSLGRLEEALENVDRALELVGALGDWGTVAQVTDTRARILLAGRDFVQAELTASQAVASLGAGDEKARFADALVTHAIALARLNRISESLSRFAEAWEVAQQFVSENRASEIVVMVIEELAGDAYLKRGVDFQTASGRVEKRLIRAALEHSSGGVTEAAARLGLKHQTLSWMLNSRHADLQNKRTPMKSRRKSMIKKNVGKVIRMRRVQ